MTTAVVVPAFRQIPEQKEIVSLAQCCKVLSSYPLVFVVPESLDTAWYREFTSNVPDVRFERFSDSLFIGVEGYSRMMLSKDFYARFLKFDFILIHQLDVYCFRDDLSKWCALDYDYIGAPWLRADWHDDVCNGIKVTIFQKQHFLTRQLTKLRWALNGIRNRDLNVGNGGCSLRKVRRFHELASEHHSLPSSIYNEDLYWSIYLPLSFTRIRIADWRTALGFAFDSQATWCYNVANRKLPFAAHGWFREDSGYEGNLTFWKQFIDID